MYNTHLSPKSKRFLKRSYWNKEELAHYLCSPLSNYQLQEHNLKKETMQTLQKLRLESRQRIQNKFLRKQKAALPCLQVLNSVGKTKTEETNKFQRIPSEKMWLDVLRIVLLTYKSYNTMKEFFKVRQKVNEKSIKEEFSVSISSKLLSFDPSIYMRTSALQVNPYIVSICKMAPKSRTMAQKREIFSVMTVFPIFMRNFSKEERWSLVEHITYNKLEKNRVITQDNRKPMNVYFLLSGEVKVFVSVAEDDRLKQRRHFINLTRGTYFGYKDKSTLSVCASDCELFRIDRTLFYKLELNKPFEKDFEMKFKLFRNWPPIAHWSDNAISDLCTGSYLITKPGKHLILHSAKEVDNNFIWFVAEGSIDVVKVTSIEQCNKLVLNFDEATQKKERLLRFQSKVLKPIIISESRENKCDRLHYSKSPSIETIKSHFISKSTLQSQQNMRTPIYVKVRQLVEGECYGLGKLEFEDIDKYNNRFCLVGNGCTYVQTTAVLLRHLINVLGVDLQLLKKASICLDSDEKIANEVKVKVDYDNEVKDILKKFHTRR